MSPKPGSVEPSGPLDAAAANADTDTRPEHAAPEENRAGPGRADAFEPVIGLEVHVQLKTGSKIFCACSTAFGAAPNTQVCPVCLGFPGTLPVLNERAVEYAAKAALALNCTVHARSVFARKNYFYPDLPKGYQISQFDRPLATGGWLDLGSTLAGSTATLATDAAAPAPVADGTSAGEAAGGTAKPAGDGASAPELASDQPPADGGSGDHRRIRITRLHLEEDAGKSFHGVGEEGATMLDFNRCGAPLVEIVSAPDLRSPAEAYLFLTRLKQVLRYLGVSDVNMEEGSLRCDANVSVRPRGSSGLGTKTEVKNLNSFKNVERALEFEIERQVAKRESGRVVEHQTLLWDAARGEARPMRSKELSHDYRYFPEPDLGPLVLGAAELEEWRLSLPELPDAKEERLARQYGIPAYDAGVLSATAELADWYERAVAFFPQSPKEVSNWVMGEVLRVLNERQMEIDALPVQPEQLAELLTLKEQGEISGRTAKAIFEKMLEGGRGPREVLEAENLQQISDDTELRALAAAVLDEHPLEVGGYLRGREQLLTFFIGGVMKKTRGRANPQAAGKLLRDLLEERREAAAPADVRPAGEPDAAQAARPPEPHLDRSPTEDGDVPVSEGEEAPPPVKAPPDGSPETRA